MTDKIKFAVMMAGAMASAGAFANNSFDYDSVWQCNNMRKTNWYCDQEAKKPTPPKPQLQRQQSQTVVVQQSTPINHRSIVDAPPTPPAEERVTRLEDVKTIEQLRQLLKDKEDAAVMNPTEDNIKAYLEVWNHSQEKASVFADQWQRVVWKNPQLDYSINYPTTAMGLNVANQQRQQTRNMTIQALAQKHGIIFFFRSDCPYCHATSRVLKALNQQYGIEVIAASLDSGGLPEFPRPKDGRNLAQKWQVQVVPALFIANKQTAEYAPIGFGAMTMEEIIDRMFALTTPVGANF
ncbi:conjugal transfer protein TraF [Moraxella catarrhalis]|uniref:conjugal transfer protein TraF n=1 Tax=Moraxella catarrhalis TaxID=480 RepID=UPI00128C7662|nr:conjugal transfer protein TraF [Moraxella catarrhalis]MPX68933.1 conjugal transfer protein TraF [Moraxella catarrhalis]MPX85636.1 conjugal transfer protein TraF [Moraxella catarrhalis]